MDPLDLRVITDRQGCQDTRDPLASRGTLDCLDLRAKEDTEDLQALKVTSVNPDHQG